MNQRFYTGLLALGLAGLSACNQVIDIKLPPHEPEIVVVGDFPQGERHLRLWISRTFSILDQRQLDSMGWGGTWDPDNPMARAAWLDNAAVDLYIDGQLAHQFLPNPQSRFYELNLAEPLDAENKNFELRIQAPGKAQARGSSRLPDDFGLRDFRYQALAGRDAEGNSVDVIEFILEEAPQADNYYEIVLFQSPKDTSWWQGEVFPIYLSSKDPQIQNFSSSVILSDRSINGANYKLVLESSPLDTSFNDLELRIRSIPKARYFYLNSLRAQFQAQGNPFAEPVVLYTNMENGRGIFSLFREKRQRIN